MDIKMTDDEALYIRKIEAIYEEARKKAEPYRRALADIYMNQPIKPFILTEEEFDSMYSQSPKEL